MTTSSARKAQQLAKRVSETPDDGVAANDLLDEFYRGAPLHILTRLMKSANPDVVGTAMWLASELGTRIRPVFRKLMSGLDHSYWRVRFWAIDVALVGADPGDVATTCSVLRLLSDEEKSVRLNAMSFVGAVPVESLLAAYERLTSDSAYNQACLEMLGKIVYAVEKGPLEVELLLNSSDPLQRRIGAGLAMRLEETSRTMLEYAARSDDPDVCEFARNRLDV
jgi:hypothetical protein